MSPKHTTFVLGLGGGPEHITSAHDGKSDDMESGSVSEHEKSCAADVREALKSNDDEALALALKEFFADEEESEDEDEHEEEDHGEEY